jgi:hypothetical protein
MSAAQGFHRSCSPVRVGALGGEQALEGAVAGRVVGDGVVPAVPDNVQPGSGQDSHRVGVVFPRAVGEVADRMTQLFADSPAEGDGPVLAGLAGGWRGPGQADQRFGVGEPGPAVADLGEQPGGADRAGGAESCSRVPASLQ